MLALMITAATLMDAAPGKVQFSNIKFEIGESWDVAQASPRMILEIRNQAARGQVRITIEPAVTFSGTVNQGLDAAWTAALGGRRVSGDVDSQDEREVAGGGSVMVRGAPLAPRGGVIVAVVKAKDKLTKLVLTGDTDTSFQLGAMYAAELFLSLEVVEDAPPPGGAGGVGPGSLGPDPSGAFDWDGPDWFEYGIYDHDCRNLEDEYNALVGANGDIVGAVRPRAVTYADALARARRLLTDPNAKAQFDRATSEDSKRYPKLFLAGAAARLMDGDTFGALAHMLAGVASAPDDPDILFTLASMLAQVGMPNESLAVIEHLRESGKKPQLAVGLKPDAAISYLTGYDEMLRGNLAEASAKLTAASSDTFLSEASLCLALIQAKQGGNGKAAYERAAYRFKPTKLVFCTNDGKSKRPPLDEMFDSSKGARAVLSDFRHPKNWEDLLKWMGSFAPARAKELEATIEADTARVSAHPRPVDFDSPYGMWAEKTSSLMEGLDENEPLLLSMQATVDASEEDVERAASIHVERLVNADMALIQAGVQHVCPQVKENINTCLNAMRPYLVHWETVQRRYAQAWYRMATGVNAHLPKNAWHDANAASIAMGIHGLDGGIFLSIHSKYGGIATQLAMIHEECLADGDAGGTSATSPEGPGCPPGMKGLGFKYAFDIGTSGPKLGFKVDCEKFTIDVDYPLAKVGKGPLMEFGVGGFAQIEMYHRGDWTVFAGAKGSIGSSGFGVSEKAGIYVKGNALDGIKDMGGRVSLEASGKGSEFQVSKSDSMDFSIMPSPKTPPLGPGLRAFPNQ